MKFIVVALATALTLGGSGYAEQLGNAAMQEKEKLVANTRALFDEADVDVNKVDNFLMNLANDLGNKRKDLAPRNLRDSEPSSLAQTGSAQGPPTYVDQMSEWEMIASNQARKNKKMLTDLRSRFDKTTRDAISDPEMSVDNLNHFLMGLARDLNSNRKKIMASATKLGTETKSLTADIEQSETDDANVAADLKEEIDTETEEIVNEEEQAADEYVGNWEIGQESLNSYVEETKEEQMEALATIKSEQTEDVDELQDKIKDQGKTETERFKEAHAVYKEIKGMHKDITRTMDGIEDVVNSEVTKVQTAANNFPSELVQTIANSQSIASKAGMKVDAAVSKEIRAAKKDVGKEVAGLVKTMRAKASDLDGNANAVATDLTTARLATQKEVKDKLVQSVTQQEQLSGNLDLLAGETDDALNMASRQTDDLNGELEKAGRDMNMELKGETNKFNNGREQVLKKVRDTVSEATEEVMTELSQKQRKLKSENLAAIDDVDRGIKAGQEQTESTNDVLNDEVKALNSKIEGSRGNEHKLRSEMDKLRSDMGSISEETAGKINTTREMTLEELKTMRDNVDMAIESSDQQLRLNAGHARNATMDQLTDLEQNLKERDEDFSKKLKDKLVKGQRKVKANKADTDQLLASLTRVESDVERQGVQLEQEVPKTGQFVDSELEEVKTAAHEIDGKLAETRQKTLAEIEHAQGEISNDSTKRLDEAEENMKKSLAQSEERTVQVMDGLVNNVDSLKDTSKKDSKDAENELKALAKKLTATQQTSSGVSDEVEKTGTALESAMAEAAIKMRQATSAEKREADAQRVELGQVTSARIGDASAKATANLEEVGGDLKNGLDLFAQQTTGAIEGDASKLDQYLSKSMNELNGVSMKVTKLKGDIRNRQGDIERNDQAMLQKMASIAQQQAGMRTKSKKELQDERSRLGERAAHLEGLVSSKVTAFQRSQSERLNAMNRNYDSAFEEERTKEMMEQEAMNNKVGAFSKRMDGQMYSAEKSASDTERSLKSFERTEQGAAKKFGSEVGGLQSEIDVGEQRVEGAIQGEESRVGKMMQGELGGMETILGSLQKTQNAAGGEVDEMKENFDHQLSYYKNKASSETKAMADKLSQLEEGDVSLADEFNTDTASTQQEVTQTSAKLAKTLKATKAQVADYQEKTQQLKTQRQNAAVGIHKQTTALKSTMIASLGKAVGGVEHLRTNADNTFRQLKGDQVAYEMKLGKMSSFESNHDEGLIEKLGKKAYQLESSHKQLTDWQRMFKHRTMAWRNEVERRVKQLTTGLEDEQDGIMNDQLNTELKSNDRMRNMKRGMEDAVTAASRAEAGQMSGLVGNMQEQMNGLIKAEGGGEAGEHGAISRAGQYIKAGQKGTDADLNAANNGGNSLSSKTDAFRQKIEQAKATMADGADSASATKNLRFDQGIRELERKMSALSLLQTNDPKETQVQALIELNKELARENQNLKKEDDMLDSRAEKIVETARAKGITV